MTDNEIIKALECCIKSDSRDDCMKCPLGKLFYQECSRDLMKDALDLINRQKAELDDLKRDTIPKLQEGLKRANKYGVEADKENEQLKAEIERLEREIEDLESVQEISPEAKHFVDTKADKVISLLNEAIKSQEQIKSEARKEFADLSIKKICEQVCAPTPTESYIVEKCNQTIENLLKEMESENK